MSDAILIVDLGTTRVKCTLFTPDGRVLARASDSYPTATPHPTWAEQEPARWWDVSVGAARDALRQAAERAPSRDPLSVVAVGVTGQMHGVVALDRAGQPLGPCLTVQDRRAADEVAAIEGEVGATRAYAITGARLDTASPAAKLRWLHRHHPALMERAALFLAPKDYLRYRLTGEVATDPIDAAGSLLHDLQAGAWSAEMAEAARVTPRRLPPIRPSHDRAGALSREAAATLGLPSGIPVAVGAGDDVECLGAGLLAPGRALEHLGTTGSMLACGERVVVDPAMRVDCYPHAVPGLYLVGGSTSSAGATLAWAARHLAPPISGMTGDGDGATLRLDDAALDDDDEDMVVFLPYLAGERCPVWDPDGRGLLVGMTLGTSSRTIARAVFAGVAFSLRHILDTLLDLGVRIDDVVASGDDGSTSGAAWPLLRSTVYDRPILVPADSDPTALGALILTLVAAGAAPDVTTAAARVIPPLMRRIEPALASRASVERRYALYRAVSAAAAPIFAHWKV